MKEEISRILKLVQEGKISAEDAADLIDAFQGESANHSAEAPTGEAAETATGATGTAGGAPPPGPGKDPLKDGFKGFVDFMNNLEREVRESVDWKEVANQVRSGTQKGVDALKKAADDIKAGNGVNLNFFGSSETRDVTLPLSVAEGKTLRIENPCGSVKVNGGFESGSVSARAKVRGASPEDAKLKAEEYTLIVEESDHAIVIRQPKLASLNVDLVVQLSSASTVEIKTDSGDVQLLDTGGGAKITTQSGDVKLRGLNGVIEVNVMSGDLSVDDCKSSALSVESKSGDVSLVKIDGTINARAASGDLSLRDCSGKSVSIESVSGNVSADLSQPVSGSVSIRTVNGDTSLAIADGGDCRVTVSTLRGQVSCSVPLAEEARTEQRITGKLGEGTGTLDVSGINGDISVKLRDSAVL